MVSLNINSIGIIGGGPGGLASLYEFLNTSKDGESTIGTDKRPINPAFSKIVVFEQKDQPGGVWTKSNNKKEYDFEIPPQDILNTENYNDPFIIRPKNEIPDGIQESSKENPIITEKNKLQDELEWKRNGIYPFLFTNIPARFTRFSYLPNEQQYQDKSRIIYPFLYHQELEQRFIDFINQQELNQYIRTNTTIENIYKNQQCKWIITSRYKNPNTNKNECYKEEFDAIVIANGHYTIPYIPKIKGLSKFNENFPNVLIHAKSFKSIEEFENKNVLIIGGSISAANLIQYIIPVAKSITNSKRGKSIAFEFINDALKVPEIIQKETIDKIDPETGNVHFKDGSIGKYDKILITTGYHYHYPFASDYLKLVNPGNLSRVKGLYYDTFYQNDPTLGTVGIAVSHLNFHTIEASSIALAGVWSGYKQLPSLKEQQDWETSNVESKGDSIIFHYYNHHEAKEKFVDKLVNFAPKNRYNPLEIDGEFVNEIDDGLEKLSELYYSLKDKKLTIKDTSLPVE